MSLVKFKRRPFEDILSPDFWDFKTNNLFDDRMWLRKVNEHALNIIEKPDEFEIELSAPGFNKKDFDVTIDDGCLNISAKKSEENVKKEDNYTRKEFSYSSFERSLQLPENIVDEKIKAKYDNGILRFTLSKKEEVKSKKPKHIEIA